MKKSTENWTGRVLRWMKRALVIVLALTFCAQLAPPAQAAADSFKSWSQGNKRWGSLRMGANGKGPTMSDSGCLVTAITKMFIQAGQQTQKEFTPKECLAALKKYKLMDNDGDFGQWSSKEGKKFLKKYAPQLTHDPTPAHLKNPWSRKKAVEEIGSWIEEGYYVIVRVYNKSTGRPHFMTVDGVHDNDVYVMDNGGVIPLYGTKKYSGGIVDQSRFKYSGDLPFPAYANKDAASAPLSIAVPSSGELPASVACGETFRLKGTVSAGSAITELGASILDGDGNVLQSSLISPNAAKVELDKCGVDTLTFETLRTGSYLLRIDAKCESGESSVYERRFEVLPAYKMWTRTDSRWAGVKLSKDGKTTIGNSSGFVTAFTQLLIHAGQQGEDFTPDKCTAALRSYKLINNAGAMYTTKFNNKLLPGYAPELTYERTADHSAWSKAAAVKKIQEMLQNGYYVMVRVESADRWLAVDSVRDGDVYVMDGGVIPLYGTSRYAKGVTDQICFKYSGEQLFPAYDQLSGNAPAVI